MHRLIATTLIFLTLLFSSPCSSAQSASAKDPSNAEQIAVLKAQLQTQQDFQESLLSTVYWSLGTSAGIAIFLIGFSWFNNRGMHERDIASIKNELLVEIRKQQDIAAKEITDSVEGKTKPFIEAEISKLKATINSVAGKAKRTQTNLDYLRHNSEVRHWTVKDVPANVLTAYLAWLDTAITDQDDYEIAEALAGIRTTLPKIDSVLASEIPEIVSALERLPSKHTTHVEPIKKLLVKLQTY